MAQHAWPDAPTSTRQHLTSIVTALTTALHPNIQGIYLHGSLALGAFNPARSDLDLLVVTRHPLSATDRQRVIALLLQLSGQPHPIEISVLTHAQLQPWRYPPPYDLHYSETWRERSLRDLARADAPVWQDTDRPDPDLAAHITVLHARGVCLYGAAIADVFPAIPAADYLAALATDLAESLATITEEPVYPVLNCCRTWAYLHEGCILSKHAGGEWALAHLPPHLRPSVQAALQSYAADTSAEQAWDHANLEAFASFMHHTLAAILPGSTP